MHKVLMKKAAEFAEKLRMDFAALQAENHKSFGKTSKMVMALSKDLEVIKSVIKSSSEHQQTQYLETTNKFKRVDDKIFDVENNIDFKFREAVEKAESVK